MNGEEELQILDASASAGKHFLHVYDFTAGSSRLIFNKEYNSKIKVALSEIDTIAIETGLMTEHNKIFEIYDLNTGNNILAVNDQSVINYNILCMQYIPFLEGFANHLVLITMNTLAQIHIRVINLESSFIEIRNTYLTDELIYSIDISRNGRIALGGQNALFLMMWIYSPPILLYHNKSIQDVSFSPSGDNIALAINIFDIQFQESRVPVSVWSRIENTIVFGEDEDEEEADDYDDTDEDEEEADDYDDTDEDEDEDNEDEDNIEVQDPEIDTHYVPPTNQEKLAIYRNQTCFDTIQLNEEKIGEYLSADSDNIVIFYKQVEDANFLATCLTFTGLKKYLKDPKHAFYSCLPGKDFRTYHDSLPEYIKIPSQSHTLFVHYNDIKQKYIQRQNMIFLEYSERVDTTISYDASITMNFVSSNHCQQGSVIDVYRIIF